MKAIMERRSIRKYTSKNVEDDKLKKILKAGFAAPSCGNQRISHFIVIRKRETLNKIAEIHGYGKMLKEASTAVAVCANLAEEVYQGFWVQDCAAAAENMLIEAEYLDLGAVWVGIHPKKKITEDINSILEIPKEVKVLSLVALGYPAESKEASERYPKDKIHHEKW